MDNEVIRRRKDEWSGENDGGEDIADEEMLDGIVRRSSIVDYEGYERRERARAEAEAALSVGCEPYVWEHGQLNSPDGIACLCVRPAEHGGGYEGRSFDGNFAETVILPDVEAARRYIRQWITADQALSPEQRQEARREYERILFDRPDWEDIGL
jgi:hypothetical protein